MRPGALWAGVALVSTSVVAGAQRSEKSCDSVIAASAVDTVPRGLFITVYRLDSGPALSDDEAERIAIRLVQSFAVPRPLRLSVFDGPASMRGLRRSGSDTVSEARAPNVTGVYAVSAGDGGSFRPEVLRSSLLVGVDSAMLRAIAAGDDMWRQLRNQMAGLPRLRIRLSTDSSAGAHVLAYARFPRMRVHDAAPLPSPAPAFPEDARSDSLDHGEAVLRFIVDRDGQPAFETVELVRASAMPFVRAALVALNSQRFSPATIGGCPVAQVVEFPFIFDAAPRASLIDR